MAPSLAFQGLLTLECPLPHFVLSLLEAVDGYKALQDVLRLFILSCRWTAILSYICLSDFLVITS